MSLLEEIRRLDSGAAKTLEQADFCSNSDIQSLTREDLNELFSGVQKIKLRKTIDHIIHKQQPIHLVLNELKGFLPSESLKAALTGNGVLSEYLLILKDLKTQIEHVSQFMDAHITLLEEIHVNQNEKNTGVAPSKTSLTAFCPLPAITSGLAQGTTSRPTVPDDLKDGTLDKYGEESFVHLPDTGISTEMQGNHGRGITTGLVHTTTSRSPSRPLSSVGATGTSDKALATVKVLFFISGNTHGSHQTLLDRVTSRGGLQLVHTDISQECEAAVVFCPICSRPESDIEAALNMIPVSLVNKPVILVLLHHTRDANFTAPRILLPSTRHKTVTTVNALYHDSLGGLFSCSTNEQAVSEMHVALLEHSSGSGTASGHDASGEAEGKGHTISRHTDGMHGNRDKPVDASRDTSRDTDGMYGNRDKPVDASRDTSRDTDGMYGNRDKPVDASRDTSRHTDGMYGNRDQAVDAGRDTSRDTDDWYESQDKGGDATSSYVSNRGYATSIGWHSDNVRDSFNTNVSAIRRDNRRHSSVGNNRRNDSTKKGWFLWGSQSSS